MPVDVGIGTVETRITARDPDLLADGAFIARIVAAVKEELARDDLVKARREADRSASRAARRKD